MMQAFELAYAGAKIAHAGMGQHQFVALDPDSIHVAPIDRLHRWFWPTYDHCQFKHSTVDGLADWHVWDEPKRDMWGKLLPS